MAHSWDPIAPSPSPTSAADRSWSSSPDRCRRTAAGRSTSGCGAGNLTVLLARRWPRRGSSASTPARDDHGRTGRRGMASRRRHRRLGTRPSRSTYSSPTPPCNGSRATSTCCPDLVDAVAPGGWLAFQVPGNFEEPSHTIRRDLAAEAPYAEHTAVSPPPMPTTPTPTCTPCAGWAARSTPGDDVPARVPRRGPGLHLGQRHRRPPDPAGPARRPAPGVRGGVPAPPARGLPRARRRRRTAVPAGLRGGRRG